MKYRVTVKHTGKVYTFDSLGESLPGFNFVFADMVHHGETDWTGVSSGNRYEILED